MAVVSSCCEMLGSVQATNVTLAFCLKQKGKLVTKLTKKDNRQVVMVFMGRANLLLR